MGFTLRPYQRAAIDETFSRWKAGKKSLLVVMATGLGKTVLFGAVAERFAAEGRNVLILVHRDELVRQVQRSVGRWLGYDPQIDKAQEKADPLAAVSLLDRQDGQRCRVVVGSV